MLGLVNPSILNSKLEIFACMVVAFASRDTFVLLLATSIEPVALATLLIDRMDSVIKSFTNCNLS
jgi:hypothetical protein